MRDVTLLIWTIAVSLVGSILVTIFVPDDWFAKFVVIFGSMISGFATRELVYIVQEKKKSKVVTNEK